MAAGDPAATVEEELAWEDRRRTLAGVAAILAGLMTLGGTIIYSLVLSGRPRVTLLDSLRDAAGMPLSAGQAGLRTAQVIFYHDHAAEIVGSAVILAIGALAIVPAMGFLFRASKARKSEIPRLGLIGVVAGATVLAAATLVLYIGIAIRSGTFATSSDHSTKAAHDSLAGGILVAGQYLYSVSGLLLALGFVIVALNAQRVGLLTRFMGVLGMISGALFVIPLSPLPIVQCFWLIALGALIMQRWPNGVPPAWSTGEAIPWPTQQELREARSGAADGPVDDSPAVDPGPERPPQQSLPSSGKRKRKR